MGMTQANLHRTAKAMSITVCIQATTQYNVAMTFINDRTLGELVNTKHYNTMQKLNVLEGYSSKIIKFNRRNARSCTYRLIILLPEDGSDSWK